jgi:hypothetical protein
MTSPSEVVEAWRSRSVERRRAMGMEFEVLPLLDLRFLAMHSTWGAAQILQPGLFGK